MISAPILDACSDFAAAINPSMPILSLVFGAMIGSFLNVVVYRLPIMMDRDIDLAIAEIKHPGVQGDPKDKFDLSKPDSMCPSCKHPIAWWQNIPVVSWIILRGRCHYCSASISVRYPAVELLSALLTFAIWYRFGTSLHFLFIAFGAYLAIALSLIDWDHMIIDPKLCQLLLWSGLAYQALEHNSDQAIAGALFGFFSFYIVRTVYFWLKAEEGLGQGDLSLILAIGVWVGPKFVFAVVGIAGLYLIFAYSIRGARQLPYGPGLLLGMLLVQILPVSAYASTFVNH